MRSPIRFPAVALTILVAVKAGAVAEAPLPSGRELEAAGARIGTIRIHRLNIFDPTDPKEDYRLYRLANRLHIMTREQAIRRELLFREGDPYRQDLINETERNLRNLNIIRHVRIRPVAYHDGLVDLEVSSQDTWTLRPSVHISRAGGDTATSFSFSELNLLGRVKVLQINRRNEIDRSTTGLLYSDPRLFGSRLSLNAFYDDSSDGVSRGLALSRPFFALGSRWSMNASAQHLEQTSRLFEDGDTVSEFRQFSESLNFSYAFSTGYRDDRVRRYGFGYGYLRNVFTQEPGDEGFCPDPRPDDCIPVPHSQKFSGPFFALQRLKSRFIKVTNYNKFDREEDFNLGNELSLTTQLSLRSLGADRSEAIVSLADAFGVSLSESANLFFSLSLTGRAGAGEVSNVISSEAAESYRRISNVTFSEAAESYWRMTSHQTLYTRLAFDAGIHLDGENQLLLGGETGLRGYPTRQFAGDRRLLFTLEHRYFGDWEILRLFRIGFASFADVGDAWYGSDGEKLSDLHPDFGFGLRFAVIRSSVASVSRLDLAYSVDAGQTDSPRLQILFGTALKF